MIIRFINYLRKFLLILIFCPIFIVFENNSIKIFRGQETGIILPVGVLSLILLFLQKINYKLYRKNVLLLGLFFLISLTISLQSAFYKNTFSPIIFFIQTIFPIAFYFIGKSISSSFLKIFSRKVISTILFIISFPLILLFFGKSNKTYYDANAYIYQLHDYFPVLLALGCFIFLENKKFNFKSFLLANISLINMFFCKSKNIIISFLLTYVLISLLSKRLYKKILFLIIAIFLFFYIENPAHEGFKIFAQNIKDDKSYITRLQSLQNACEIIQTNIFFGLKYDLVKTKTHNTNSDNETTNSHNQYLTIALRSGLIGFILYFSFVFSEIYFVLKIKSYEKSFKMFILFILFSSLFQDNLTQTFSGALFFLILGSNAENIKPFHQLKY